MALFGKKKEKTIDFTNRMVRQRERTESIREGMKARTAEQSSGRQAPADLSSGTGFGFLDNVASSASYGQTSYDQNSYPTYGASQSKANSEEDADEKKRKLAKRLMDITEKLEEISNQIYHLQQRVEVLEKKTDTGGFGY